MNNTLKKPVTDTLDIALMLAGFWMLFSPAILHFNSENPENWLSVLSGFVVIVLAFSVRRAFRNWELWLIAGIGAVLVAMPWIAAFGPDTRATPNAVLCGIFIFAAAVGRWYAHSQGMDKGPTAA